MTSENGAYLKTTQLTAANGSAVYPIITTIKDKELLVAYALQSRSEIKYGGTW